MRRACDRCGSCRVVEGSCFDCWHRADDWKDGRLEPVDSRIVWERKDGTRWRWEFVGDGWRQVVDA